MGVQLFSSTAISAGPLPAWDGCALTPPSGLGEVTQAVFLLSRRIYLGPQYYVFRGLFEATH
jgi:hypothetical protein